MANQDGESILLSVNKFHLAESMAGKVVDPSVLHKDPLARRSVIGKGCGFSGSENESSGPIIRYHRPPNNINVSSLFKSENNNKIDDQEYFDE